MNITQTEKGEQLVSIKISVAKEDYEPKVNDSLKKMRQKANVPGFRPGMVPMGMVKKMYGMQAKMEVLNDLVSEGLNKHIVDNNLNLIGYPLSDPDQQTPADLEHQETMEFWFEAAIRPEIKYDLSNTMVDFYHVVPEEKEIQETIDNLVKRNPNVSHPETVEENDRLELKIREAEDGKEVEGGFQRDGFFFDLKTITAKTERRNSSARKSVPNSSSTSRKVSTRKKLHRNSSAKMLLPIATITSSSTTSSARKLPN